MKKLLFILCVFYFSGQSWGQERIKKDVTAAYIAPRAALKKKFQVSSGAFVFDATKRMGVSNIFQKSDGTYTFKYLGEEQPDAIYETLKEFLADAGASVNNITFNAQVVSNVGSLIENLTEKSKAHIFLRSSLYRVNEALFNEDIQEESYKQLFSEIIAAAKDIELKELEHIKSEEPKKTESVKQ